MIETATTIMFSRSVTNGLCLRESQSTWLLEKTIAQRLATACRDPERATVTRLTL